MHHPPFAQANSLGLWSAAIYRRTPKADGLLRGEGLRTPVGFTLVELLVVMAIIGMLVALLLPAVQAARESARMLQCENHVKQISLAAMGHEQANGWLPTGGWGFGWVGDPNCGFGRGQPGGFFYNCLPYMEQQPLHDLQSTTAGTTARMQAALQMCQTPLGALTCPSRRPPMLVPVAPGNSVVNCAPANALFTADYKCNGGSEVILWGYGPSSWADAANWAGKPAGAAGNPFCDMSATNGICAQRSRVRMADILDGTSNTYLVGEKYSNPDESSNDDDTSGDHAALSGDDNDLLGWTDQPPMQDTPGVENENIFGSAHANAFNMAFCDGAVHRIAYTIDAETHRRLGNRKDGLTVDGRRFD
jgi:prepilin-type N-terminal cleavage/methylation domain-containing protein